MVSKSWNLRPSCSMTPTPPQGASPSTPAAPLPGLSGPQPASRVGSPSPSTGGSRTSVDTPAPPAPHGRYRARACKPRPLPAAPPRPYDAILSKPGGVHLGLGCSDIPHAGWGVFALRPIKTGTVVLDYSGPMRTKAWVECPTNDVRYVWADENNADVLARTGQSPIYVDANPAVSSSWGGRVNDGFHRGSHLRVDRVANSDRVVLTAIAPIHADEELYLEYGADYWQGHFPSLPPSVQAEAAAHYDLTIVAGRCYTPLQRLAASDAGEIHRIGKRWHDGPAPAPRIRRPPPAPSAPPRLAMRPAPHPPAAPHADLAPIHRIGDEPHRAAPQGSATTRGHATPVLQRPGTGPLVIVPPAAGEPGAPPPLTPPSSPPPAVPPSGRSQPV